MFLRKLRLNTGSSLTWHKNIVLGQNRILKVYSNLKQHKKEDFLKPLFDKHNLRIGLKELNKKKIDLARYYQLHLVESCLKMLLLVVITFTPRITVYKLSYSNI